MNVDEISLDRLRPWRGGPIATGLALRAPTCRRSDPHRRARPRMMALALVFALGFHHRVALGDSEKGGTDDGGRLDQGGGLSAYYYPPLDRRGQRPVVVYLHGRGGNPAADCAKWARVAREVGWLLCPSGQEDRGEGARGWANNWIAARAIVDRALVELRGVGGHRVQLRGNTIVGFSEGAFVAMNIGIREPDVFNRWLILAANESYWGPEGDTELAKSHRIVKRVYLLTGQQDSVVQSSRAVFDMLDHADIHVVLRTVPDLGHEVPAEKMRALYRRPIKWLNAVR